jgi:dipeptidyl aminopeptidase/acylaminoacyl peptidase
MSTTAPYGTWESPLDARTVSRHDGMPRWVDTHGDSTWWCEPRPAEDGRVALVRRRPDGSVETMVPPPWNVRSRVHEYGGRCYLVLPDGESFVFAEYSDQRLYRAAPDSAPVPLTPEPSRPSGLRYVEPLLSTDGREVWCIREEHRSETPTDVARAIVAVPLDGAAGEDGDAVRVVVEDTHFLACPQVSPDGTRLAWIGWEHPAMPWDSTELRVAGLRDDGTAGEPRAVAGGAGEAVVQACWLDDSALLAATDRSDWWNLHRVEPDTGRVVNVCPRDEEFGGPLWMLGARWFGRLADGRVAALHGAGPFRLGLLDVATGRLADVETPHTEWAGLLHVDGDRVAGIAGAADRAFEVVTVDPDSGRWSVVSEPVAPSYRDVLPVPQARTFAGDHGRPVHAHVYPPRNPGYAAPPGEAPPYVVFVHGGPTSRSPMVEDLEVAYFTSRGLGVVDVNYGGSTGYGREYRNRLREQWGVVDVADCVSVARGLVADGLADPGRLAIRGLSAGGWTTAVALTSTDVFACGTISCPILDLATWREAGTHDFEAQYLESLVGLWPEEVRRYTDRSPLAGTGRPAGPFLLLQGAEDVICPPEQAERFLAGAAGVPHAHLVFDGEEHGFRKESTMVAALEAELSLYGQVFGFEPPGIPRLDLNP